jgi:hypothetical protein
MKMRSVLLLGLGLVLAACTNEANPETTTPSRPKSEAPYRYAILKTVNRKLVTNYHVWIKDTAFTEEGLTKFAKIFRTENCIGDCNISLYDTDKIRNGGDAFGLEGKEYVEFADHFIGNSGFGSPDDPIWWYPYQDGKYAKSGGRNWKKKPVK